MPGSISDETGEDAVYDNHLADTATETYDRELDYTLEENSDHVLAEIDASPRPNRGRHVRHLFTTAARRFRTSGSRRCRGQRCASTASVEQERR